MANGRDRECTSVERPGGDAVTRPVLCTKNLGSKTEKRVGQTHRQRSTMPLDKVESEFSNEVKARRRFAIFAVTHNVAERRAARVEREPPPPSRLSPQQRSTRPLCSAPLGLAHPRWNTMDSSSSQSSPMVWARRVWGSSSRGLEPD